MPSKRESVSMVACVDDDSVRLVNADTDEEIACLGDAVDVEVLCKSRGRDRWELRLARVES